MKVICEHIDKCELLDSFNETFCNHSHPHDKICACSSSECGFLNENNYNTIVVCKPVIQYERKLKLKKLKKW